MELRLGIRAKADPAIESPGSGRPRLAIPRTSALELADIGWIADGVSREMALSIPACLAARNLIVGTACQMALYRYRGDERLATGWLNRPDSSTSWPAMLGGTVDDLVFHGRAYWLILERDAEGWPRAARWMPFVDVSPETRSTGGSWSELLGYRVAGIRGLIPPENLIRFDSPLPPLLVVGARTLSAAVALEDAAKRFSSVEIPAGILENQGAELGPDEAEAEVARFQSLRLKYGIAWVQGVKYSREALSPADLQLVEARAAVATDVARLLNVPVAMIGASPSGNASALLYSNLSQQLAVLVASAVAPHLRTIEDTLSDVALPGQQSCAFDVQTFLRSDPSAAADYAIALYQAGLITVDEGRGFLGIPSSIDAPDLAPGKV